MKEANCPAVHGVSAQGKRLYYHEVLPISVVRKANSTRCSDQSWDKGRTLAPKQPMGRDLIRDEADSEGLLFKGLQKFSPSTSIEIHPTVRFIYKKIDANRPRVLS